VLYLAYFFPPLGGGGVQRTLKFAKYLPEYDWQPIIVTARHRRYWIVDDSLEDEIPDAVPVHRTFSPDGAYVLGAIARGRGRDGSVVRAAGLTSRLRRLGLSLFVPDVYRPWKPFALREARRILRSTDVDAIITTSSPDSAHLIGRDLQGETGLPWVADFRDPWTQRISYDPPTRWHRHVNAALEREVVTRASAVVVTTDETRDDFRRRYPGVEGSKFVVIPNGFDREDFPRSPREPRWDRFQVLYSGQLTAGRSIDPLLAVLAGFFDRAPSARGLTDVRLVGPREIENDAKVRGAGLADVVRFEGPLPHRDAVENLATAHVLVLLENMGPRAGLIAQAKLYEYLFSGRTIVALVPDGAVRRIVTGTAAGVSGNAESLGEPVEHLARAFDAWRERRLLPGAPRSALVSYSRHVLASDLAGLLDTLVTREN
jgi:glycosyltransferase involved in cell wall biosynthesis